MRSKLIVALLLALATSWVGCSHVKNVPKKRRYSAIQEEVLEGMQELNRHLASINDESSLQTALPQIRSVLGRLTALIQEARQLQVDIGGVNARNEEQMIERLKPVMSELQSQFVRISRFPGARDIGEEMMKLSRVATAPPPPPSPGSTPTAPSGPANATERNDLKSLGLAYHQFVDANRAPPKSWQDLLSFCSQQGNPAAARITALRDRGAVVFFGIHFREATIGSSNYVLGFEKQTPRSGGWVLFLDGATIHLTPAQLCGHLKVQSGVDRKVHGKSPPVQVLFPPNVASNPEIPPHLEHLANQPTQPPAPPASPSGFPTIPKQDESDDGDGIGQGSSAASGPAPLSSPGMAGGSTPTIFGGSDRQSGPTAGGVPDPFGKSDGSSEDSSSATTSPRAGDGNVPSPFGSSGSSPSSTPAATSGRGDSNGGAVPSPFGSGGPSSRPTTPSTTGSAEDDTDSGTVPSPFSPRRSNGPASAEGPDAAQSDDDGNSPSVPSPFGAKRPRSSSNSPDPKSDSDDGPVADPFNSRNSSDSRTGSAPGGRILDTELVGGSGGSAFRHVGNAGQFVVGLRYRLGSWEGQQRLGKIEPLFAGTAPGPGWQAVAGRDGYAVGAIQVEGDQYVNAIRIAFMRIKDGRLDTQDKYVSDWIGVPQGSQPKTINCAGAPVVGIFGRATAVVDAIGLIFVQ